jgi:hypothetical protein
MPENPYALSAFVNLLIATMILQGVREITIRGETGGSLRDQQGLHAMHDCAENAVQAYQRKLGGADANHWFHFLVRARNMLEPGYYGLFPGFRTELRRKAATLVNLQGQSLGSYVFDADIPFAKSILERGHANMRLHADFLTSAFLLGQAKIAA